MNGVLDIAAAQPATNAAGKYSAALEAIRRGGHSGVYAIVQGGKPVYVGESHSGRLFETITRHFREWEPKHDPQGRRRGGTMYDRRRSRVAFTVTEADTAQVLQYAEIDRLSPRDNTLAGVYVDGVDVEVLPNPPDRTNIDRGIAAMLFCNEYEADAPITMLCPPLGLSVSFLYGDSSWGIRKCVMKHAETEGLSIDALFRGIAETIDDPEVLPDHPRADRVELRRGRWVVVLQLRKDDRDSSWVVTGYDRSVEIKRKKKKRKRRR